VDAVNAVRLAALGLGVIGLLAAVGGTLRGRGDRQLAPLSTVLGAAGLGLSAAMAVLLPPIAFKTPVLWTLLAGGALAGLLAGWAVHLRRDPRGIVLRGGAWHLLPAAVALVALQVAAFAGSIDGLVVSTAATVACAAFAAAAGALVLARGALARPRAVSVAAPVVTAPAPSPRPATGPPASSATASPVRTLCGTCGAAVHAGWNHCVTCGAALAWT
jgi:hypothetical protein